MAAFDLQQNLSQQQILSPQMRQSLEILQANSMELGQLLQQAMEVNPVLEVVTHEESLPSDEHTDAEHDAETLDNLDDDYRESQITEHASAGPSQETIDYLYNSIVAPQTLQQHLAEQVKAEDLSAELKSAVHEIISHINDRGYLEQAVEDLAITSSHPLFLLEKALIRVQHLDPAGVAAIDLRESLLIQLQMREMLGSLSYQIVDNHLEDLAHKRIPKLAKLLDVSIEEVVAAAETIASLTPDPGAKFDPTANPHIQPDIYFEKSLNAADEEWVARLNNDYLPEISISNTYKDLMASSSDSKTRNYLKEHIRNGKTIIRSLTQRQQTLTAIAKIIIAKQHAFLDHGFAKLKPFTMQEVAEIIGVHPATISRAVAGKFILTPHGVTELRKLFTSGYQSSDGNQVANTSIKETIQGIVNNEPASKPISDSAIEKLLQAKGIRIARRTIAKYRDQLGILPSHLRKKF